MINLSTAPDIMLKELMADKTKSIYWLKKHFGGEKAYEKMRDNLIRECKRDRKNKISETVEYRSANGNRWLTYECARYFKDAKMVYTEPYAFCFYETLGSVGAFVPVRLGENNMVGQDGIIIFNSHFFMQMSVRLGLKYRSPEMVRAFHEFIPSLLFSFYKEEDKVKLHVRLPGSIGFGVMMSAQPPVFEVRTFLADVALNSKQRRMTATLRENADKFAYEPLDVQQKRLADLKESGGSFEEEARKFKEKCLLMGMTEEEFNVTLNLNLWIVNIFVKMGLANIDDSGFWQRHTANNGEIIHQYYRSGNMTDEGFDELLMKCAENNGYRNFDLQKAHEIIRTELKV